MRIGVFEDYPPFGSIGPDMKPQGYDIDMANLIGRALSAKVELVQVTGDNRMAYLADRKTDMLLSVGRTPERAKVIDFSNAYAPYYLAVFGPKSLAVKGNADLAGKSVAVARGTLEDLSVSKVAPPSATIKRFDDPNGAIAAFLSGRRNCSWSATTSARRSSRAIRRSIRSRSSRCSARPTTSA